MDGFVFRWIDSPIGRLKSVARGGKLAAILWEDDDPKRVRLGAMVEDAADPTLLEVERQLGEYFAGRRDRFDLPLGLAGTDFQRSVWEALIAIPFGETRSYGQLAAELGRPRAARAVGAANGKNPISVIVPCHRLVGSTGALRGFAGGLETRAFLIGLEGGRS